MFFERRCPVCGAEHRSVCARCVAELERAPGVAIDGVGQLIALLAYDPLSSRVVLAGKNGGRRDLLRWGGAHLAREVQRSRVGGGELDLVTWVPAHPARRRERGYDQGEILARSVARRLGLPCRSTLRRAGGESQKGLSRSLRLQGPRVRARRRLSGSVLLVDDVATTGTSLGRCAEVLIASGAATVDAAVLAAAVAESVFLEEERGPIIYIGGPPGIRQCAT